MRKIGIISLYEGYNFGNRLQNYAVEKLLKDRGYETYTFRYEIDHSKRDELVSPINKIKPGYLRNYLKIHLGRKIPMKDSCYSLVARLSCFFSSRQKVLLNAKKQREAAYSSFDSNYLHFADYIIRLGEKNEEWTDCYAYFVCGSDQVWNPHYASTSDICFLQFAPEEKRVAFIPSFGVSEIPQTKIEVFSNWINHIPVLSVREERGREIIKELTGRDSKLLVDPTMLITKDEWIDFAKKPKFELPNRYLLSYFLGNRTKEYDSRQRELAQSLNIEIVNLLDLMQPQYYGCSPNEFVYCVQHAEAICSDSFHASVFSILFEKPFVAFDRVEGGRKMGSRIHTLLQKFNMEDRFYNGMPITLKFAESNKVAMVLEQERGEARRFFDKAFV